MTNFPVSTNQITARNSSDLVSLLRSSPVDTLPWWVEQYFDLEVTTSASSQKAQRRDLALFLAYVRGEEGSEERLVWVPRLSRAFRDALAATCNPDGSRHWSDRTVNRVLATLKTFSRWVHKIAPFPLGDPMKGIKNLKVAGRLDVEAALTKSERRRMLDAADNLPVVGGRSRDRRRHGSTPPAERPQRRTYRPYRNRAVVYTLVETGMRRAAVTSVNLDNVDFERGTVRTAEKGGEEHVYQISNQGLAAIRDYVERERPEDAEHWGTQTLFLSPASTPRGDGRLNERVVNTIWSQVAELAGVKGKTPHSARHAMGLHIIEKTGNIAAVQAQLGHRSPATSMQYCRVRGSDLRAVIDDRSD